MLRGRMISAALCLGLLLMAAQPACSLIIDTSELDEGWLEGWTARKKITIDRQRFDGDLSNFPVGIIRDADPELAATSTGLDLAFTQVGSTALLSHEIERFDPVTGALTAWVRLPSLPGRALTELYIYYGNPDANFLDNIADTWVSGFAGVWHLAEDPAAINLAQDSGPHLNSGEFRGGPTYTTDAPTGAALDFDGNDDCVLIGDPEDGSLDFGADQSFSFSLWANVDSPAGTFDTPWSKGANADDPGYHMILGERWHASISLDVAVKDQVSVGGDVRNRWVHRAVVVDREANRMVGYADGIQVAMEDPLTVLDPSTDNDALIGSLTSCGQDPFLGKIDEVRVYDVALSEAWIVAENANLADPASFLTVGVEERQ